MCYNLFLDDVRKPVDAYKYTGFNPLINDSWVIVRNYEAFVYAIEKNGIPDFISFDHDLALDHYPPQEAWSSQDKYDEWESKNQSVEKTGYHCALWLIDYCIDNKIKICDFFVHSMNPYGGQKIKSILTQFTKHQEKNGI